MRYLTIVNLENTPFCLRYLFVRIEIGLKVFCFFFSFQELSKDDIERKLHTKIIVIINNNVA